MANRFVVIQMSFFQPLDDFVSVVKSAFADKADNVFVALLACVDQALQPFKAVFADRFIVD